MKQRLRPTVALLLCLPLSLGAVTAYADEPGQAPDGQQFQNQSPATRSAFVGTFGIACAPREWAWQHTLAVDPDNFGGPPASDGQKFSDQDDDDVQLPFVALFGTQANAEWLAEHNAVVAHHVLAQSVAPVPCPAVMSARQAPLIGTTHLRDALEAASAGNVAEASDLFTQFKVIWASARPRLSDAQARQVQAAVDHASDALTPTTGQPPSQAQYAPALQTLLRTVRATNATFASSGASADDGN